MNLVDAVVIEVLSEPVYVAADWGEYWKVKVRANCYGREYETTITCETHQEAQAIQKGYRWLT